MKKNESINRSVFRCLNVSMLNMTLGTFFSNYRLKENNGKIVKKTVQSLQEVMMGKKLFHREI